MFGHSQVLFKKRFQPEIIATQKAPFLLQILYFIYQTLFGNKGEHILKIKKIRHSHAFGITVRRLLTSVGEIESLFPLKVSIVVSNLKKSFFECITTRFNAFLSKKIISEIV